MSVWFSYHGYIFFFKWRCMAAKVEWCRAVVTADKIPTFATGITAIMVVSFPWKWTLGIGCLAFRLENVLTRALWSQASKGSIAVQWGYSSRDLNNRLVQCWNGKKLSYRYDIQMPLTFGYRTSIWILDIWIPDK